MIEAGNPHKSWMFFLYTEVLDGLNFHEEASTGTELSMHLI